MSDESRRRDDQEKELERERREAEEKKSGTGDKRQPNPPYTTKHGITAPKFGSAGSGGAENEPGPEKD